MVGAQDDMQVGEKWERLKIVRLGAWMLELG